ncbi:MAG: glycine--tRNA ligase subunit beta [Deferribacteres bacterium]|nr:glycine--tRNA ligase subunit beta [Deferribacteres bacterium]
MKPLLFEIGSEEIPARFISSGLAVLKERLLQVLERASISYGRISEYATPRRLALYIEDVSEKQKDRTIEHIGPPRKVAFDDQGKPTKAATGFARSLNIDVKELAIKKTDRGEYVAATVKEKGRAARDVLARELPEMISTLHLPRSMRWGDGSLRYFRPIQWILAVLGSDIIKFKLDGIKSGNVSYGHRFLSPVAVKIENPAKYLYLLKQNHVIADPAERKEAILKGIRKIQSLTGCRAHEDPGLLDTVTNLVEYPTVVSGGFDGKYLDLPRELLVTVMKSHQKYFPAEDAEGRMLPSFFVVSNTLPVNNDTVRKGAERVLRARLEDARFYYMEDRKKPLRDYTEDLKKVTFQERLGSIYEKSERISSLSLFIAGRLNIRSKEKLQRASMLCKADLVTGVVGEFPELQGYMGMIYALDSGEDKEVAQAVYEHYLPKFPGDKLPSGQTGTIVSLADKMDNIASFFYLGLIPTGSEDPYALRRQAAGIISILEANDFSLPLNDLSDHALQCLEPSPEQRQALCRRILEFFAQRLEGVLLSRGYSHDIISAVLSTDELDIKDVKRRIDILSGFRKDTGFPGLLTAAKRVYNILARAQAGPVDENLLAEPAEKELYRVAAKVNGTLADTDYRSLFELEGPVNTFFDRVLVMDKDPRVRENRLALLMTVKRAFDSLGDFSKIVEQ